MGTLNRYERNNGTIVSEVSLLAYMNTFSPDSMRDDVGVMFLRQGVPGNGSQSTVSPIELASQQPPAGAQCQVAGWGRTEKVRAAVTLVEISVILHPLVIDKTFLCARIDIMFINIEI